MRIVQYTARQDDGFGILQGGRVIALEGWPAEDVRETGVDHDVGEVQLRCPVSPSKIVGVGRNYRAHVAEMGYQLPQEPTIFLKPPSSLLADGGDVVLPPTELSQKVQHEAELAVVIGQRAHRLRPEDALAIVAGVTCANDVSARDLQRQDNTITRGKGFDTFCPIGPWVETEFDLTSTVTVSCRVNGELRQEGTTDDLIFDIPSILAFVTQVMTLERGDVVLTGSPGGTADLHPGDLVEIEVGGVGTLRHGVRAADAAADTD